ncbi:unnamed protein product [Leuciscus chuanchicus]
MLLMTSSLTTPLQAHHLRYRGPSDSFKHCQAASLEPVLSEVTSVCASHLEELMGTSGTSANPLHMIYRIAMFLTPKMRQLRMVCPDARDEVVKGAKEIILKMRFDQVLSPAEEPPPAKKQSFSDRSTDWEDSASCISTAKPVDAEIAEYLSTDSWTTQIQAVCLNGGDSTECAFLGSENAFYFEYPCI